MSESNDRVQCANCGALNFRSSETCWQCGQPLKAQDNQQPETPIIPPVTPQPGFAQPPPSRQGGDTNIYIILGFIFAALGLFCCPIFGVAGIVMGAIASSKGNKLGIWVIATSVVLLVIYTVIVVFALKTGYMMPGTRGLPGNQFPMPAPSPAPSPIPQVK